MDTDTTAFFNTNTLSIFKPKDRWRPPCSSRTKSKLITRHGPGYWKKAPRLMEFLPAIADNMEEGGERSPKASCATQRFTGDDLKVLESQGRRDRRCHAEVPGHRGSRPVFVQSAQPNLGVHGGRAAGGAGNGINVPDVQDAIDTAVGGKACPHRCSRAKPALRLGGAFSAPYRSTKEAIV